ncbi:hypothetical protein PIB30_093660 [Stylosanthes scabra]|uniref:RRM domain-containing protein n=1 Tax=Stylosanthes scabra TaxID=79078 RepID=A0ABU6RW48_9FABA|nr:hypothetical protein [Stylosanthes scabra]
MNGQWETVTRTRRKPSSHWRQRQQPTRNQSWIQAREIRGTRKEVKELEDRTFSVFVDNLPVDTTKEWLWKVFSSTGKVEDVYLSGKTRRSNPLRFVFVRYKSLGKRGGRTGGNREVEASGSREGKEKKETGEWGIQALGESKIMLEGDRDIRERLQRSMVGETLNPYDFVTLKKIFKTEWSAIEYVKMMGAMKILIIFDSCQSLEAAIDSEWWDQHFIEVRKWSSKEVCRTRKVWLEITDRNVWGRVLQLEEEEGEHYSAFKVLVEANAGPAIRAFATVVVDDEEFTIFVKEEGGMRSREVCMSEEAIVQTGDNREVCRDLSLDSSAGQIRPPQAAVEAEAETDESKVGETQQTPILDEQRNEEANDSVEVVGLAKNNNGPSVDGVEMESLGRPTRTVTHNDDRRTDEIIQEWEEDCYQKTITYVWTILENH